MYKDIVAIKLRDVLGSLGNATLIRSFTEYKKAISAIVGALGSKVVEGENGVSIRFNYPDLFELLYTARYAGIDGYRDFLVSNFAMAILEDQDLVKESFEWLRKFVTSFVTGVKWNIGGFGRISESDFLLQLMKIHWGIEVDKRRRNRGRGEDGFYTNQAFLGLHDLRTNAVYEIVPDNFKDCSSLGGGSTFLYGTFGKRALLGYTRSRDDERVTSLNFCKDYLDYLGATSLSDIRNLGLPFACEYNPAFFKLVIVTSDLERFVDTVISGVKEAMKGEGLAFDVVFEYCKTSFSRSLSGAGEFKISTSQSTSRYGTLEDLDFGVSDRGHRKTFGDGIRWDSFHLSNCYLPNSLKSVSFEVKDRKMVSNDTLSAEPEISAYIDSIVRFDGLGGFQIDYQGGYLWFALRNIDGLSLNEKMGVSSGKLVSSTSGFPVLSYAEVESVAGYLNGMGKNGEGLFFHAVGEGFKGDRVLVEDDVVTYSRSNYGIVTNTRYIEEVVSGAKEWEWNKVYPKVTPYVIMHHVSLRIAKYLMEHFMLGRSVELLTTKCNSKDVLSRSTGETKDGVPIVNVLVDGIETIGVKGGLLVFKLRGGKFASFDVANLIAGKIV